MRQLFLRASRIVSWHVVEALNARGHAGLRATRAMLLSNMELAGSTVRQVAERAGITKQAMGRIAAELESAGNVQIAVDPSDRRARVVTLTDAGQTLVADSFAVMAELEQRHALVMGQDGLTALLEGLRVFNAAMDPR